MIFIRETDFILIIFIIFNDESLQSEIGSK